MQLTYSLNKRDVFFARMLWTFQNKILLIFFILTACLFGASLSTGDEAHKFGAVVRIVTAIFGFGFAAVFYFAVMLLLNWIMVYSSKLAGIVGVHTLEIKEEGLEESTAVNKSLHRWNPSFRIKESSGYVWIYPTDQQFFLVPTKPGRCQGDLAGFLNELRAKLKSHTASP